MKPCNLCGNTVISKKTLSEDIDKSGMYGVMYFMYFCPICQRSTEAMRTEDEAEKKWDEMNDMEADNDRHISRTKRKRL